MSETVGLTIDGGDIKACARARLFGVDQQVRYYGELASRYQRHHTQVQLLMLVLSLAVPTSSMISPSVLVPATVGWLLAALIAWAMIGGHANKAAILHNISTDCERIKSEQIQLYILIKGDIISETVAGQRLEDLAKRMIETTGRARNAQVPVDWGLLNKCQSDTNRVLLVEEGRRVQAPASLKPERCQKNGISPIPESDQATTN